MPSSRPRCATSPPASPARPTCSRSPRVRVPQPKAGEVLIEVSHAGVNRPDCLQRAGAYPPPPDASPIIGLEVAGRSSRAATACTTWRVGDAVCALTPGGGYAEYCTTPAGFCLPIPAGLTATRGGEPAGERSSPSGTTSSTAAACARRDRADPRRHERHRPHRDPARASSFGATVIATAGSDDKAAFCRRDGRRPRDQLPDAGLRRRGRAHHRQARRRRRARHGRRRLHREEPEVPRARGPARHHRVPARQPRRGRLAAHHDEAADGHRLDASREPRRAQGRASRRRCARTSGRCSSAAR